MSYYTVYNYIYTVLKHYNGEAKIEAKPYHDKDTLYFETGPDFEDVQLQ